MNQKVEVGAFYFNNSRTWFKKIAVVLLSAYELQKAQEKVDELTQRLLELQEQKQSIEVKQIMDAFRRSGKSMQELLTFLDV